MLKALPS